MAKGPDTATRRRVLQALRTALEDSPYQGTVSARSELNGLRVERPSGKILEVLVPNFFPTGKRFIYELSRMITKPGTLPVPVFNRDPIGATAFVPLVSREAARPDKSLKLYTEYQRDQMIRLRKTEKYVLAKTGARQSLVYVSMLNGVAQLSEVHLGPVTLDRTHLGPRHSSYGYAKMKELSKAYKLASEGLPFAEVGSIKVVRTRSGAPVLGVPVPPRGG